MKGYSNIHNIRWIKGKCKNMKAVMFLQGVLQYMNVHLPQLILNRTQTAIYYLAMDKNVIINSSQINCNRSSYFH